MAKKAGQNKAAAIREYMAANKGDGPKAVAEGLKKQGVDVTPEYVSMIKSADKSKKKKGGKRGRKAAAAMPTTRTAAATYSGDALLQAKKFLDQAGGVANAKAALDIVAKLTD